MAVCHRDRNFCIVRHVHFAGELRQAFDHRVATDIARPDHRVIFDAGIACHSTADHSGIRADVDRIVNRCGVRNPTATVSVEAAFSKLMEAGRRVVSGFKPFWHRTINLNHVRVTVAGVVQLLPEKTVVNVRCGSDRERDVTLVALQRIFQRARLARLHFGITRATIRRYSNNTPAPGRGWVLRQAIRAARARTARFKRKYARLGVCCRSILNHPLKIQDDAGRTRIRDQQNMVVTVNFRRVVRRYRKAFALQIHRFHACATQENG